MDYETLLKSIDKEPDYLFRTARGSAYAHLPEGQTVRNRSGESHSDTTTGVQPRSTKTMYVDQRGVNAIGSWIQDPMTATRLVPEMKDGKFTGHALVQMAEDHYTPASKYGPERSLKAGQVVSRVPVSMAPSVGAYPVEILGSSESPKGSKARNIHFGNAITEVIPQGRMVGGSGGAPLMSRPPMGGDRNILHNLNQLALKASGGVVKMPEHYSQGGWKLI
jgi:hypothetical protein